MCFCTTQSSFYALLCVFIKGYLTTYHIDVKLWVVYQIMNLYIQIYLNGNVK